MKSRSSIFFDLDGTLIDVEDRYYQAHVDACNRTAIVPLQKNNYWNLKRKKTAENEIVNVPAEVFFHYEEVRIKNLEDEAFLAIDRPFNGVINMLEKLTKENHLLFIVTMRKHADRVIRQLQMLDLDVYFNSILSVPVHTNPAAEKAKLIQSQENVYHNYKMKYMIGDTEADILCGKQLGFKTIALESGIRAPELLKPYAPDALLKNVVEFISSSNAKSFL